MKDADLDGCPDPENGEERYGVCQLKNVERGRSEAVMSSTERARSSTRFGATTSGRPSCVLVHITSSHEEKMLTIYLDILFCVIANRTDPWNTGKGACNASLSGFHQDLQTIL